MTTFERLKAATPASWRAYTDHDFVRQMGDGSLSQDAFRHYLVQDYLFLIHFARAYALAVYKGRNLADMRAAAAGISAILDVEMKLHLKLCGEWGLSPEEIEAAPEARATMAYTRFVLDTGLRGDLLDLHVALSPCIIGYAEIGMALVNVAGGVDEKNPYAVWIKEYSGTEYQEIAEAARANLDRLAADSLTEARFPKLAVIFDQATRLEADFWQMGLDRAL
ncbi:thiaminase/transcriptional activator TenA [Rhodobium orientis]|uniref:Aminopyrimidine aminohydrolase n=1 Tax=Rhodobium orientis TaxID=34017 RepID=A0A327K168_9HYPH|nr:thiaminase II [Rhodobium orientis]MBB4302618.1 thiaminase/transcriptional activator TenA [Rhodobium orientis]MBK5951512.1 thiaminase II [Rhodobium orientis]RAI29108.1 thiaminase II [Rhodobium orientis]